jgi:Ca-activated chloride channel family protein
MNMPDFIQTLLPQQLHFLRPEWFYAFIPLLLLTVFLFRRKASSMNWRNVCDPQLLPHILVGKSKSSSRWPYLLMALTSALCIVALAGPVWKKLPQPVFREESALVIALDLSQSMQATDIKPSRLARARLKILDILQSRKGGQTALIAFAANAFTVTPLTDDDNTIANLVPSLDPGLMPAQGSNATAALETSLELLKQAGVAKGDILLITDGVSSDDHEAIKQIAAKGHRLSILGIGTLDGSPIPLSGGFLQDTEGAIVISKLQPASLQQAALMGGGIFASMQADDGDIERLTILFDSQHMTQDAEQTDLAADIWQEEGPWLLLLVIPAVALWPRRGWLACIVMLTMPVPEPAYALDKSDIWPDNSDSLWIKADQKAMRALDAGDNEKAARMFQDSNWKAAAHYRAGNYQRANELLDNPVTSNEFYNKGNALAKLGRYPEALNAYDEALKLNPHNEDAAYNRDLVNQAQKQQEQQQQGQQQDQQGDQDNQQQQSNDQRQDQQQQDQQQDGESQQQMSESGNSLQDDQQQSDSNQQPKESEQPETHQQEQLSHEEESEQESEQQDRTAQQQHEAEYAENADTVEDQQATEQWLRRIPDDPGGLMRRKFEYQYKRMPNQQPSEQPW